MFDLIMSGLGYLIGITFILLFVGVPVISMVSDNIELFKMFKNNEGGKNAGDDTGTKKTD